MIKRDDIKIVGIANDKYRLNKVYRDGYLVFSLTNWDVDTSCFGNGYWVNTLPWINSDAWRNN